jgi:hypothetical protein
MADPSFVLFAASFSETRERACVRRQMTARAFRRNRCELPVSGGYVPSAPRHRHSGPSPATSLWTRSWECSNPASV